MSCYLMEPETIAMIAKQVTHLRLARSCDRGEKSKELARKLATENVKSVCSRYGKTFEDHQFFIDRAVKHAGSLPSNYTGIDAVQWLKTINCLEYQSCDHWGGSYTNPEYGMMRNLFIDSLPGYSEANWGGPLDND